MMTEVMTASGRDLPMTVKRITVDQTMLWTNAAWADFKAAPGLGLALGSFYVAASWLLTAGLSWMGLASLIPALAGGFMLISPLLALVFYEVARRREAGEPVTLGAAIAGSLRHAHRMGGMAVVLTVAYLAWLEMALFIVAAFLGGAPPTVGDLASRIMDSPQGMVFLLVGTAAGAVLAAVVFTLTVVSIPLLHDRRLDAITAMRVSIRAVAENPRPMLGWALNVGFIAGAGLLSFYVGLALAMPILGYASWHAYRDLVE